jgi:hypothetical protein
MNDADYKAAFNMVVMPLAYKFQPELVLISAGFDAAAGDPLGQMRVTPRGYAHMTSSLKMIAGGKLVLVLEGGYVFVFVFVFIFVPFTLFVILHAVRSRDVICVTSPPSFSAAATPLLPRRESLSLALYLVTTSCLCARVLRYHLAENAHARRYNLKSISQSIAACASVMLGGVPEHSSEDETETHQQAIMSILETMRELAPHWEHFEMQQKMMRHFAETARMHERMESLGPMMGAVVGGGGGGLSEDGGYGEGSGGSGSGALELDGGDASMQGEGSEASDGSVIERI